MNAISIRKFLSEFGVPNALSPAMIPAIARAMTASVVEAGVQARDEEAAATQGPPRKKKLLDEGSLQEIEEDAAAPSASSLPPGERAGVLLCLLGSVEGRGGVHLSSIIDSLFVTSRDKVTVAVDLILYEERSI